MTRFTYIFVGVMVGMMTFMASSLFGSDLAGMVTNMQANTQPGFGDLTGMMTAPIVWALLNPAGGALLAGTMWPLALFWIGASTLVGAIGASYGFATGVSVDLGAGILY